jgi:hypothetical protein
VVCVSVDHHIGPVWIKTIVLNGVDTKLVISDHSRPATLLHGSEKPALSTHHSAPPPHRARSSPSTSTLSLKPKIGPILPFWALIAAGGPQETVEGKKKTAKNNKPLKTLPNTRTTWSRALKKILYSVPLSPKRRKNNNKPSTSKGIHLFICRMYNNKKRKEVYKLQGGFD